MCLAAADRAEISLLRAGSSTGNRGCPSGGRRTQLGPPRPAAKVVLPHLCLHACVPSSLCLAVMVHPECSHQACRLTPRNAAMTKADQMRLSKAPLCAGRALAADARAEELAVPSRTTRSGLPLQPQAARKRALPPAAPPGKRQKLSQAAARQQPASRPATSRQPVKQPAAAAAVHRSRPAAQPAAQLAPRPAGRTQPNAQPAVQLTGRKQPTTRPAARKQGSALTAAQPAGRKQALQQAAARPAPRPGARRQPSRGAPQPAAEPTPAAEPAPKAAAQPPEENLRTVRPRPLHIKDKARPALVTACCSMQQVHD